MKNKKFTAKMDGELRRQFQELDQDRQDQVRYYLKIRITELLQEQNDEKCHSRKSFRNPLI